MNTKLHLLFVSLLTFPSFCVQAKAQDSGFGATIYADHCAVCHGKTGSGDGPVGELFAKRPSNLRLLAKGNTGMFPTERVIDMIYGRTSVQAHGQSKMPVWGDYFMIEALKAHALDPADAAMIAEGRVLSVVSYLKKLQIE